MSNNSTAGNTGHEHFMATDFQNLHQKGATQNRGRCKEGSKKQLAKANGCRHAKLAFHPIIKKQRRERSPGSSMHFIPLYQRHALPCTNRDPQRSRYRFSHQIWPLLGRIDRGPSTSQSKSLSFLPRSEPNGRLVMICLTSFLP